ncbi:aromatic acid exporter family protein [Streptomyces sp. NPDC002671]
MWSSTHQPYEEGQLCGTRAEISAIFAVRECKRKSATAAIARMSATLISFVLCLVYVAFLPFQTWGLALLVGLGVLVPGLRACGESRCCFAIWDSLVWYAHP